MRRKTHAVPVNPILISDLPRADEEALTTFVRIPGNTYQNSSIGKWKAQDEGTSCDCHYEPGRSEGYKACGEGSDCINRLTLVECIEGDCPSRSYCQNQRFQRRQYADIGVVQTEKKGFGLRALSDIPSDAFIYEYVGEVVQERELIRRMQKYAQEGIRHFYFMMLQKDEFIDATKKGDIGRFANHSCNPNCYVSKWFVGKRIRMGIFAKRKILKDEELTFNYNVDRYGHDAQECYCGEANCVGYIGGKTQTDIGGMDDLYIDALGITDDIERLSLKGSRKKKGRKLDEDFVPELKPIQEEEVPLICQAIRAASGSNKKMLPHLLTRLTISLDLDALRGIMRLRGFSLMNTLLEDHEDDPHIVKLILEAMYPWPLLNRNKVEDSHIEEPVKKCAKTNNEEIRTLAQRLLDLWAGLETAYRIPRRAMKIEDLEGQPIRVIPAAERPTKRPHIEDEDDADLVPAFKLNTVSKPLSAPLASPSSKATSATPALAQSQAQPQRSTGPTKEELNAIILRATEAAAARNAAVAAEAAAADAAIAAAAAVASTAPSAKPRSKHRGKDKDKNGGTPKKEKGKSVDLNKKLLKLVGEVVVKYMSRYRNDMNHDTFKKHAKELTHLITEKEKKSSSYQAGKIDSLSDEKRQKMKKFVHDYVKKVLKRLKAKSSSTERSSLLANGKGDALNGTSHGHGEALSSTPTGNEVDDMVLDILDDEDTANGHGDGDEEEIADEVGDDVDEPQNRSESPGSSMVMSPPP
ncbi:hypothetical protein BS47DRAFT_1340595 [Hydnum rufescens UP504]|uniref:Histone-lysine N-methyltransferase, H3 lysine-36 specific n=1 Tax=Hydnum rufescens UP504 TaxID=1448309 RepID=A0A9P6B2Y0_9AGAM|nr:hypothetical protein BS47DRAFT_1340595 [Hydnum rufescens UP504]